VWAADITGDDNPYEGGLAFCVRDDKEFIGSDAVRGFEPERRLRCVVLGDPLEVALGNEPVSVEGRVCGRVTSGGYGYTVERSIAYAYLPVEAGPGTEVELDLFGTTVPGEVVKEPLFDPKGERVRNLDAALASG
jgi:glycine cleavage system aminomethyltransferase T